LQAIALAALDQLRAENESQLVAALTRVRL
jgi:hypothetical protein